MITKIGTPASHRMTSRSMEASLGRRRAASLTEHEARRNRGVAVVSTPHRCPPAGSQREKQAGRGYDDGGPVEISGSGDGEVSASYQAEEGELEKSIDSGGRGISGLGGGQIRSGHLLILAPGFL